MPFNNNQAKSLFNSKQFKCFINLYKIAQSKGYGVLCGESYQRRNEKKRKENSCLKL